MAGNDMLVGWISNANLTVTLKIFATIGHLLDSFGFCNPMGYFHLCQSEIHLSWLGSSTHTVLNFEFRQIRNLSLSRKYKMWRGSPCRWWWNWGSNVLPLACLKLDTAIADYYSLVLKHLLGKLVTVLGAHYLMVRISPLFIFAIIHKKE